MQHRTHLAEFSATETLKEVVFVQVISDVAVRQVTKFVAIAQIIDGDDLGFVALVERLNECDAQLKMKLPSAPSSLGLSARSSTKNDCFSASNAAFDHFSNLSAPAQ